MKVKCIIDERVPCKPNVKSKYTSGEGLKKGNIYNVLSDEIFIGASGYKCYFIEGLGLKACFRFKKIEEKKVSQEMISEKLLLNEINLN